MGYRIPSWSPSNVLAAPRKNTPETRNDMAYLSRRRSFPEGLYLIECWPYEMRMKITFSFYHCDQFQPAETLLERDYPSRELALAEWDRYNAYHAAIQGLRDQHTHFCTPVIQRDKAIQVLRLDTEHGVRRVRNGKRYLIYITYHHQPCEHWFTTHIHAVRVMVRDPQNQTIITEEFDCDHVWKGIQFYLQTLEDFSSVALEAQL